MHDRRGSCSGPIEMACRGCASGKTSVVVDLGVIPASDWFPLIDDPGRDPRWPLRLYMCEDCLLAQLGPMCTRLRSPRGRWSRPHREHMPHESAGEVVRVEGLAAGASIIELDSHHGGSWLDGFVKAG